MYEGILTWRAAEHAGAITRCALEDNAKTVRVRSRKVLRTLFDGDTAVGNGIERKALETLLKSQLPSALYAYELLFELGKSLEHQEHCLRNAEAGLKHGDILVRDAACTVLSTLQVKATQVMRLLFVCAIRDSGTDVRKAACSALVALHSH